MRQGPARLWWLAVVALLGAAEAGAAGPDKAACVGAHAASQELRQSGKLREAREQLLVCSNAACPAIARGDCGKWLAEVEKELPTVVLQAQGEGGKEAAGARVLLDGSTLTESIDGSPLFVDPGAHTFRFEAPGAEPSEQKVTLKPGEKNRLVSAQLVMKPAPSPAPSATEGQAAAGPPAGAYVLGAVGLVGLGAFGYFGLSGRSAQRDLDECKPRCDRGDAESAQRKYLIADVGLGVGVVSLGIATYLFLSRPDEPPRAGALRLDVRVVPGGSTAMVGGQF